ncbi:hypothetical protein [Priestia taiwanensis]|uniref:Uncharacterized protein n=1 Tax=Priestia taiwanensis TaxID=1347902 RepID=A0A917AUS9_9BACI|nr:hypothetical protein [Priestia taiwanensis]MBM7363560.1 hypothetical protein [Priestia taiwanensis]GGE76087.1 hypothetical protein GCM10007140_27310 [Priestia taiwanensis]
MDYNRLMRETPKDYSKLDDENFQELIQLDIKNKLNEQLARQLRKDEESVVKWLKELKSLYADLLTQFSRRKNEDEEYKAELKLRYNGKEFTKRWATRKAETSRWKKNVGRYKENLKLRLDEAKELNTKFKQQPQPMKKSDASLERVKLKKAIAEIADLIRHEQSFDEFEENQKKILSIIERAVGKSIREMFDNQDRKEKRTPIK